MASLASTPRAGFVERIEVRLKQGDRARLAKQLRASNASNGSGGGGRRGRRRFKTLSDWIRWRLQLQD